jgi:hypothetical protein
LLLLPPHAASAHSAAASPRVVLDMSCLPGFMV